MVSRYVELLQIPVSAERLESYRQEGSDDLEMVATYFWNVLLSEALYPSLNIAEIALRNAIHRSLTEHFNDAFWFDTRGLLEETQRRQVSRARENVRVYRKNTTHTAGMVVAELSFGFWVGMLNRPYESKIWRAEKFRLLRTAFPYSTRRTRRLPVLRRRFFSILRLRNRVFHYEPIWYESELSNTHRQIVEATGWISPVIRDSMQTFDRFQAVLHGGLASVRTRLVDQIAHDGSHSDQ